MNVSPRRDKLHFSDLLYSYISFNQSMYFKKRVKQYNLQIYINIFYFYMIYL